MKKSFLKVLLMLSVLLALIPITTATCEELMYNDTFKYEINEGGKDISIIKCISNDAKITVPDEIDGLPVTVIKKHAFEYSSIESIALSKNLTTIEEYAFSECRSLQRLSIPNLVTTIGDCAFADCRSLGSITIPNSVVSVGTAVLYSCSNLQMVTYKGDFKDLAKIINNFRNMVVQCNDYIVSNVSNCGDGVESFVQNEDTIIIAGEGAITRTISCSDEDKIKTAIIEDGVTRIGESAFSGFTNLESVTIPDSVTSIGEYAFSGTALINNEANLENGVFYINDMLVDAKKNTDSAYTVKDGTKVICDGAFKYMNSLTEVTIPDSVTSIGKYAFYECGGLTSIKIGSGVKSIGTRAFGYYYGHRFDSVYITDLAEWCGIAFSDSDANPLNRAKNFYLNNALVTELVIPDGVTSIGFSAFNGCSGLRSVAIPDTVESIGNYAFRDCSSLTSVVIPDSVTSIGEGTFRGCTGLASASIGNSVASIGDYAFSDCTGLTGITIPDSVTSIGEYAFSGCTGLINITIGESVESIGNDAFVGCDSLAGITIPNSVTSIGNSVFYGCDNLANVRIGSGLESIGEQVFLDCGCLTSFDVDENNANYSSQDGVLFDKNKTTLLVYPTSKEGDYIIPDGVEKLESFAFYNCKALTNIKIPDSVTRICASAFSKSGLINSENQIDGILYIDNCLISASSTANNIKDGTRVIADNAFYESDITSIIIPDSVVSIGEETFRYSDITSITIGNGIKKIGANAFYNNRYKLKNVYITDLGAWCGIDFDNIEANPLSHADNLYLNNELVTEAVIPDGTLGIGKYTFYEYYKLTSITIPDSVTNIGEKAFYNCYNIADVHISDIAKWCAIDFAGDEANPLHRAKKLYLNNELVTELVIPDGVTDIGKYAFYNCGSLISVTIPDSVTSIGEKAFSDCTNLSGVHISDIAKWCAIDFEKSDDEYYEINSNPLYYAKELYLNNEPVTELAIPDGVTSIGKYAFYNCRNLTSVTIPKSVTSIKDHAFGNCDINNTYYKGSETQWKKIDIGEYNNLFSSITYAEESEPEPDPTPDPTPAPTPMPEITAEIVRTDADTDTSYTFTVTPENPNENCSVYAAVYDKNGALLAVSRETLQTSGDTVVSVNKSDADVIVKVFIWADKTIQPVLEKAEIFDLN